MINCQVVCKHGIGFTSTMVRYARLHSRESAFAHPRVVSNSPLAVVVNELSLLVNVYVHLSLR